MITIDSKINLGNEVTHDFSVEYIKNEPMLFRADRKTAMELGGPLTKLFLDNLNDEFSASPILIDSRVHMLMKGWYPCIPGFHHDDVPREREDKQPEYHNPSYHPKHALMLFGGASQTEFALGKADFPEVPLNEICYKIWHPIVVEKLKTGELESFMTPFNQVIYFDDRSWHQGTPAYEKGFRFFIRATINSKLTAKNELRRQSQVYLENPMEGW